MNKNQKLYMNLLTKLFVGISLFIQITSAFALSQGPMIDGYYPTYPATTTTPDKSLAEKIKKGEYLAMIGDCISCHTDTKHGKAAFAGGYEFKTPFGTFYTPNITPDKKTGIGNWSQYDFKRALKQGLDPQGHNYLPIFPFAYFANTSDDDIEALYTYFMHIPPVVQENKPLPFPFSLPGGRFSQWGWKLLFFFPNTPYKPDPSQSPAWNRGKYLVDGLGHCSMCHTPLNAFGAAKQRYYLTGGFIDGYWAPNITKKGLESVTVFEVADVFKKNMLINKAGPIAGPMAEVNHNSLSRLTHEDQIAIATYLKTVESEEPNSVPNMSIAKPNLQRGKQVYVNTCIICHQNGVMTAPRIGNSVNWNMRLNSSGLNGLYRHAIDGFNSMPYKGACVTCTDNDVISAVDYLLHESLTRSQWIDLKQKDHSRKAISGKVIYEENCAICHNEGKLGAPKIGDHSVWKPLIKQNIDILVLNALQNKKHPIHGGCKLCTDGEVIEAVKYMVSQSQTSGNYSLW